MVDKQRVDKQRRKFAIIGGTGLTKLENLEVVRREIVMTSFGEPSSVLEFGCIDGAVEQEVVFLARHGHAHNIPPHMVNYRANIKALKSIGVTSIFAINAVGGIREDMVPGTLAVPDQIIDYTTRRVNSFFESNLSHVTHIDFSYPYNAELIQWVLNAAQQQGIDIIKDGTYAATEGPRLETAAEIQRLKRDGCDMVGMTGMPEAALARELQMEYASICVNANWAAGISDELISMQAIEQNLLSGMANVRKLLAQLFSQFFSQF